MPRGTTASRMERPGDRTAGGAGPTDAGALAITRTAVLEKWDVLLNPESDYTSFHTAYYAHELTKRNASDNTSNLGALLARVQAHRSPHLLDASLFAFLSPLSRGIILADEVGLGKTIEVAFGPSNRSASSPSVRPSSRPSRRRSTDESATTLPWSRCCPGREARGSSSRTSRTSRATSGTRSS